MKTGMSRTLIKYAEHKDEAGFSLLEVVAALGILSMMLMVIYEISLGGMHRAETAKREMLSLALAQSLMDEKLASSNWQEGSDDGEQAGLKWTLAISPYEASEATNRRERYQLFKLSVTVGEHIELESLKRVEVTR